MTYPKVIFTSNKTLDSIAGKQGQFLVCRDTEKVYIDVTDDKRLDISGRIFEDIMSNIDMSETVKDFDITGQTITITLGDGTIKTFITQDNDTTYDLATATADGLMSSADFNKLNKTAEDINILSNKITDMEYDISTIPESLLAKLANLEAYIGYTDSDIYGLEADFENNKFTRLAGAVGKNPGADFDHINAFGGRRRCNVYNNGAVVYDSNDMDGWDTSVVDVKQRLFSVMVEQPKFYYKIIPLKTEKIEGADGYHLCKARYYISDTPKAGFKVHPAFIQDNREVDKIYLSAFEGSIWSTESGRLTEDEQIANFNTDVLTSITDVKPASGTTQTLTVANARKLAQNRGAGWGIATIQTLSITQLLFIIEYATFNAQTAIGYGNNNTDDSILTGSTASLGNVTGSTSSGGVSYRGEENLWGNISHFIDGLTIDGDKYELTNNMTSSLAVPDTQGWIKQFGYDFNNDYLFCPSAIGGNSALPIGDFMVVSATHARNRVIIGGGNYKDITRPGLFYLLGSLDLTYHGAYYGARLIYIPQLTEI